MKDETNIADLRTRTKKFALRIIRLFRALPKTTEGQLLDEGCVMNLNRPCSLSVFHPSSFIVHRSSFILHPLSFILLFALVPCAHGFDEVVDSVMYQSPN